MRAGVADILPLPLRQVELAQALERLGVDLDRRGDDGRPKGGWCARSRAGAVSARRPS